LIGALKANGFQAVAGMRRPPAFDLWVVAAKGAMADAARNAFFSAGGSPCAFGSFSFRHACVK